MHANISKSTEYAFLILISDPYDIVCIDMDVPIRCVKIPIKISVVFSVPLKISGRCASWTTSQGQTTILINPITMTGSPRSRSFTFWSKLELQYSDYLIPIVPYDDGVSAQSMIHSDHISVNST
jgi:hypothetical protein